MSTPHPDGEPSTGPVTSPPTGTATSATGRGLLSTTFLTNIPNPYNGYLYDELRQRGLDVRVRYKGLPASEGRPWDLEPAAPDRVARSIWHERGLLTEGGSDGRRALILSGSWATPRDAARRAASVLAHRKGSRTLVWGEPMSSRRGLRNVARRGYFSAPGLDAVLAIGSHAITSYRTATAGRVPIHVFPYTTSSGLDVAPDRADTPVVGFTGRLIPYKGADVAVRALGAIPASSRPRLEVVGSGPLEAELRSLAHAEGVEATFHGEVSPARLAELRSRWWLCLVPSQQVDGWGLVVPEALNSGVPVVASGFVGAAHDLLREGQSGSIVPRPVAGDPTSWARSIRLVLDDDHDRLATRARAVGIAFGPDRAAAWLHDLLTSDLSDERSFIDEGWARLPGS